MDEAGKVVVGTVSFHGTHIPVHNPHVEIYDAPVKIGMFYDASDNSFVRNIEKSLALVPKAPIPVAPIEPPAAAQPKKSWLPWRKR